MKEEARIPLASAILNLARPPFSTLRTATKLNNKPSADSHYRTAWVLYMLGWVVCLPLKQAFKLFYYSRLALGRQPAAQLREDHLQLGQVRRVQPLAGGHRHGQQQLELPVVRDWD